MILVLALNPPGGPHAPAAPTNAARGPLLSLVEHPEWRQFLILAATKRADELAKLSELPDMPGRDNASVAASIADKFAGLPAAREADPDDQTGSIADVPAATMPLDIGETSSTELPVSATPEERPPVIKTPERVRAPKESQLRPKHRVRHARLRLKTAEPTPPPLNLLEAIFGNGQSKTPTAGKQSSRPAATPIQN